jgi:hypothetical protein
VSPDGKLLAYVRRVRLQSVLYVRDLESGRDRPVFRNLDKDLQEAWAIHGLYPQYAWTPDSTSIVIWGEGKLWRVDCANGTGTPIPFQARVEQTLNAPVRVPRAVHPAEFPVRMLRDVRVSDGRLVVGARRASACATLPAASRAPDSARDGKETFEFFLRSRATVSGSHDLERLGSRPRSRRAV